MYNIRIMEIKDYEEIYELWKNTPGVGLSGNDDSKESITIFLTKNPTTNFIAEIDQKIIGTIMAGHDGRRGHIYHLVIKEGYRKKGIAKKLVEKTQDALKKEGIKKISLVVFKENKIGNNFWRKIGYKTREDLKYRDKRIE
ncbi:N-acetyltransferase [Spirochaetia bacterium]|nr:N-acetyltransferase [Spirochaetia bacterium]GHU30895.1 N-acetyltransferase [Spirochaetia bacterium]